MSQSKMRVRGVDPVTGATVTYTIGEDGIPEGFFNYSGGDISNKTYNAYQYKFRRMAPSKVGSEIFDIGYRPPGWSKKLTVKSTWYKRFIPGSRHGRTSMAFKRVMGGIIRPRYGSRQFGRYKDFKLGLNSSSSMTKRMERMVSLRKTMMSKGFDINRSGTAFVRVRNVNMVSPIAKPKKVLLDSGSRLQTFGKGSFSHKGFRSVMKRADFIGKVDRALTAKGLRLDSIGVHYNRASTFRPGITRNRMQWLQNNLRMKEKYANAILEKKFRGKLSSTFGKLKVYGMNINGEIKSKIYTIESKAGVYKRKLAGVSLEGKKLKEILGGSNILRGVALPRVTRGVISMNMHNYDEVTYKLIEYQVWITDIQPKEFALALQKSVPAQIKRKYKNKNDGQWPMNAPNWFRKKAFSGYDKRVMHQHDTRPDRHSYGKPLSLSVETVDSHISVEVVGGMVIISGLEEAFKSNPYVWFHETGYTTNGVSVPARPFIAPGVQEGVAQAIRWVLERNPSTSTNYGTYWNSRSAASYLNAQRNIMGRLGRWIWWFMPPSEYWKYLGMYADIMATLKGYLLNPETLAKFASAFAVGKFGGMFGVPLTKKSRRRRFRHKLWS